MSNWYLDLETVETWAWMDALTPEQCKQVIEYAEKKGTKKGVVGFGENTKEDDTIRNSDVLFLESSDKEIHWLYQHCAWLVKEANERFFGYDLHAIETLQYTKYSADAGNQYYGKHVDNSTTGYNGAHRKLSFSILLTDESEYEGGKLQFHFYDKPEIPKQDVGKAIFFPSHNLHEVTPVTKGTRISLVGWVNGPRFR
jgi:PKHD-type hydroxylase